MNNCNCKINTYLKVVFILFVFFLFIQKISAQSKKYETFAVGFYNIENLFDTINNPKTWDNDFTPSGKYKYTSEIYKEKLENLSRPLSEIGNLLADERLAIIGLAEVENRNVLEDLLSQADLKDKNYDIIHVDSKDERGIEVALLYQKELFEPIFSTTLFVDISKTDKEDFTRDILYVKGKLNNELIHVFVNHWPSRRGGAEQSAPYRIKAAKVLKQATDSILNVNNQAKIILMGDFNDDPIDNSVQLFSNEFYNPYLQKFRNGKGTLEYRKKWNLFDQILITNNFLEKENNFYYKAEIYKPSYLIQQNGKFAGSPFRTFSYGNFIDGYSDHLPVYIYLLKEVQY